MGDFSSYANLTLNHKKKKKLPGKALTTVTSLFSLLFQTKWFLDHLFLLVGINIYLITAI